MFEIIPDKAIVSLIDKNILKIEFMRNSDIGQNDARQIIEVALRIIGDQKHCNLIDIRNNGYIDSEARNYFAKYYDSPTLAIAIIINNKMQKSFSNLYLTINKPVIKTKFFINQFEAIDWLKSELKN